MPLVAHVERDHFVAVLAADGKGVTYSCTDCGHWPGGQVRVTWEQWREMKPGLMVAISKKDSIAEKTIAAILGDSTPTSVQVASASGAVATKELAVTSQITAIAAK